MRDENGEEIIDPGVYDVDGKTLHVFLTGTEEIGHRLWACMASDHGPMCRLCCEVDGMMNACLVNVLDGRMVCRQNADGEFQFRVTRAGADAVQAMVKRSNDVDSGMSDDGA